MNYKSVRGLSRYWGSAGCAAVLLLQVSAASAEWDERLYNPKPQEDDVILPMPCDGAMVFRKVHIPATGPLDDYPINIGQDGTGWGYVEQRRPSYVSGNFSEGEGVSRYYLLAKYETTQLQYDALMGDECPSPSTRLRLPMVSVSWFDATAAADRYNLWLRENSEDTLPQEDGVLGFVRLPTEIEWEYAARGGLEVGVAEFRDGRYPMPEGLNGHEWFAGPQSANGQLQLAGLLQPNPLGLHDLLGNAAEMMFEPFRLNKLDRQHGQAGGFVVRGGNYLTPQSDIRTALRGEEPYYRDSGQAQSGQVGFRLSLVAPALTSRDRIAAIEASWQELGTDLEASNASQESPGTVEQLSSLASELEDTALQEQLRDLESQLRASNQRQEEARNLAVRASLNLGSFLCTKLEDDGVFLDFLHNNYQINCESGNADSSCGMRQQRLEEQDARLQALSRYYASSLVESATLYGESLLEEQVDVFEEIITRNRQLTQLKPYLHTHWENQRDYLQQQHISTDAWLENCKAMAN
ncbi:formylglycine-generating enzyme family protein [Halomonas sp. 7T]|uniref:formylglycine-generating enzyme family protein n=1 Tax=Halomonas sp. 7T TaxID=2893469 RepID=UPI0021D91370|nr:formylglycine-generating enzyme family protein [Halomonas sp. 7T]UXZ55124.1 formylglycine-generating enzyme family protein [Halomonas sp. 7T]